MKAIQFDEPKSMQVIDLAEPPEPGPGETLVRVHRVGICGTDYSGYLGKMPFFSYPRIPGHELGVEVVTVGDCETTIKSGDRCSVEPYINCQKCYSCLRGHTNCCEHHQTLGVHADGGLRTLFTVPTRKLHLSKALTYEQLALVEPLAIGFHAVERGQPLPQETVLVIGAGPIGLAAFEFSRLRGSRTIVMDVNDGRLALVRDRFGIKEVLHAGKGKELSILIELTSGRLADVVIDATGSNASMSDCLRYASFAGRVVYVGITMNDLNVTHATLMHRRELTLLASRNALSADFNHIIQLIESGSIDTTPWISHTATLEDLPVLLPEFLKAQSQLIKAVVQIT